MNKQQLRAQIAALQDATMDENKNFRTAYDEGKFDALTAVDALLDSLQEEPVSKELEKAAREHSNNIDNIYGSVGGMVRNAYKAGAQWQKEHLWKPADGDDLPDIDREVIVLYQPYPLENNECAISFAHRPNSDGWDGKNLLTDEIEHYTPETYDKGGWNIPDVKWWLDLELPKTMEE